MLVPVQSRGPSFLMIEGGLALIAVVVASLWPATGARFYQRIERGFTQLARRQTASVLFVGLAAATLRLAILPLSPIPKPFILDGFSYLLAGDTFASGRLTNPTPAMWTHFETFQVDMKPTYMSMYFPAQGMVLAAGKLLFGHPWFGLLCVNALMCAAICWMLQAWLPPGWALLGGALAVLRLGLFSYWIDSYSGGAAIAALGGALVLGALPRFMKRARMRDALLLSAGWVILANSRPYEGLLLSIPTLFVLAHWFFRGENRPPVWLLLRRVAVPLLLLIAAGAWTGYYNHRVFGNPLTEPYKINRATYAIAPHFVWQPTHTEPVYRHVVMRNFYAGWELDEYKKLQTLAGFSSETLLKFFRALLFFAGFSLLPAGLMLPHTLADRKMQVLWFCMLSLTAGMLMETWLIPHYLSPFTAAFYALGLQCARHLRLWKPQGRPVGLAMIRLLIASCVLLAGLRTWARPLHLHLGSWPTTYWFGAEGFGEDRAKVQASLERRPGQQLVLVRYSPNHNPVDEWVYNAADIDDSKVIWAREMSAAEDRELLDYYRNRSVWLVEPDRSPVQAAPYQPPFAVAPMAAAIRNDRRGD
jgi:hypothetical protein